LYVAKQIYNKNTLPNCYELKDNSGLLNLFQTETTFFSSNALQFFNKQKISFMHIAYSSRPTKKVKLKKSTGYNAFQRKQKYTWPTGRKVQCNNRIYCVIYTIWLQRNYKFIPTTFQTAN
jgi:hypothetical protein